MLHELHKIIPYQLLTVPPHFSACAVTITSNDLKAGNLHTVSSETVKNPGERLTSVSSASSLSLGVLRESVWQLMVALILYSSPLAYFSS